MRFTGTKKVEVGAIEKEFLSEFPSGAQVAYSIIPKIRDLAQPLKSEVRAVFDQSTHLLWEVLTGVSGAGLLSVLLMKNVALRADMDEQWALEETAADNNATDVESLAAELPQVHDINK